MLRIFDHLVSFHTTFNIYICTEPQHGTGSLLPLTDLSKMSLDQCTFQAAIVRSDFSCVSQHLEAFVFGYRQIESGIVNLTFAVCLKIKTTERAGITERDHILTLMARNWKFLSCSFFNVVLVDLFIPIHEKCLVRICFEGGVYSQRSL